MTYQLFYVSTAAHRMSESDLAELLQEARNFNADHGLTGMLLYLDGVFVQVLEGSQEAVRSLYKKIERDPRHYGPEVYYEGEASAREFPEWTMGFRSLSGLTPAELPGFASLSAWRAAASPASLSPGSLRKMLITLVEVNRES